MTGRVVFSDDEQGLIDFYRNRFCSTESDEYRKVVEARDNNKTWCHIEQTKYPGVSLLIEFHIIDMIVDWFKTQGIDIIMSFNTLFSGHSFPSIIRIKKEIK